jgi:Domain of unknown function (DUF1911)
MTAQMKPRQQFLSMKFAAIFDRHLGESAAFWASNKPQSDSDEEAASIASSAVARDAYARLLLHYTAGSPIEPLRNELADVVAAHERWREAKQVFLKEPKEPALYFAEIAQYERCVQLIGLCYLLHRRELLPRIAAMQDDIYAGTDTLYEDLLAWHLKDRHDVDEWYHDKPYRQLINCLYRETDAERLADLQAYCKAWYPAMKKAPWHDSHLRMTDTDGDYFGYWAFEAGAVALLCEIDDSTIAHIVYPKDLVAWARAHPELAPVPAEPRAMLRCEAGNPCPREGWWVTLAASVNNRRRFKTGELMPDLHNKDIATIWYWSEQQGGDA